MSSEIYKTMMRKVKRMADRSRELKELSHAEKRLGKLVLGFIEKVEKARMSADNGQDFVIAVDQEVAMLDSKLRFIDSGVYAELAWNGDTEEWQKLRVEGIKIHWSSDYRKNNPGVPEEEYVGIESLWLEGVD